MKLQYDNKLVSSFLLYLDREIQSKGQAYQNYSGLLYKVTSPINGLFAYAAPFKQLVNDTSITGANVMTGVYLNGTFVTIGTSGLHSINHYQGVAYFTGQLASSVTVSGRYAIKDINTETTDQEEHKVLFETKYAPKSKFNQTLSGLATDVKTLPSIFLKYKGGDAYPAAFGGIRDNKIIIRALILTESEFQRIATCNILKNFTNRTFSIVNSTPFDYLGNYTGLEYNYDNLSFDTVYSPLITDVKVKDIPLVGEYAKLGARAAMVDFTISTFMRLP